jgi:hypothetical protein
MISAILRWLQRRLDAHQCDLLERIEPAPPPRPWTIARLQQLRGGFNPARHRPVLTYLDQQTRERINELRIADIAAEYAAAAGR